MNKGTIGKLSCITAVAMTCVGLTGCGTKAKDIIKPLEDGEYEKALSIYNDADMSDKEKASLKKQLSEKLNEIVTEYNNGTLNYDDALDIISTISDMNIEELNEDIATASGSLTSLKSSKEAYNRGCNAISLEKYEEAISYFSSVINTDTNYEDSVNKIAEAQDLLYQKMKNELIDRVEDSIKSGDYGAALEEIKAFEENNEGSINDNEIAKLYDEYVNEYKTLITGKVESLIEEKDYISAIKMLENAQNVINCAEFDDLNEKIQAEKPVYLFEVKFQTSTGYEVKGEGDSIKDTIGNVYAANSNLYELTDYDDGWSETAGSVEYYLGYTYNKLHGTIAVDDVSDDVNSVLKIYGDDVVIYTLNLNRKTTPEKIEIDVSGVNYLKITLSGVEDGTLTAILSDFYFEK